MPLPTRHVAAPLRILLAIILGLALTAGLQAVPAQASNASKVKVLLAKLVKAKNPKATYTKMSKKNRKLVKNELSKGHVKMRWLPSTSTNMNTVPEGSSTARCWQRMAQAEYYGMYQWRLMFTVTNTTQVCVDGGTVSTAIVAEGFQDTIIFGWHPEGVTTGALDVDWEGRGAVHGRFDFTLNGWTLLTQTLCSQVRLNADMVHYSDSQKCSVI